MPARGNKGKPAAKSRAKPKTTQQRRQAQPGYAATMQLRAQILELRTLGRTIPQIAEQVGRATDYGWSFDCAAEAGLGLTCHAGEWGGPDSVRQALDLRCTRIGHGVQAIDDPALVRDLVERGVTLEVCPGSNIALGVYPSWGAHPIARLADAGVRVTVSTDDPPFFHTTMRHEYDRLASTFGWGDTEFRQINQWAADAAFCDASTRDRLKKEFA